MWLINISLALQNELKLSSVPCNNLKNFIILLTDDKHSFLSIFASAPGSAGYLEPVVINEAAVDSELADKSLQIINWARGGEKKNVFLFFYSDNIQYWLMLALAFAPGSHARPCLADLLL